MIRRAPGRDASTNRIDGKLIGEAQTVEKDLPALLFGRITDPAGNPLPGASIELRQPGREVQRFTADDSGEYTLTIDGSERCDLFVTTGRLSAYRLGFQPVPATRQQLDWTLADTQSAISAAPTSRNASTSIRIRRVRASPSSRRPRITCCNWTARAATSSCHPTCSTISRKRRWKRGSTGPAFRENSRVFDFGESWQSMHVQNRGRSADLRFEIIRHRALSITERIEIPGLLRTNQWIHVAAVSGKAGMKLYAEWRVGWDQWVQWEFLGHPERQVRLHRPEHVERFSRSRRFPRPDG